MSTHDLAQTHCNTMQHATKQLEHPRLNTTSSQKKRTARRARRVRPRRGQKRNPGKRFSMREAFIDGSTLLREAARLAKFDGISLDLCFWTRAARHGLAWSLELLARYAAVLESSRMGERHSKNRCAL
ncbi:hypothetical protein FOMA001_g19704 [Fusarium oxysporum f. sp. matthiolae]|nr:hypothetical protein FOMA001_g19704 [Fusarium oxysporum f. sp. matthiolae]